VLEHVPDAGALLSDIRRVLRPSGRLLVTTPSHEWLRRVLLAAVRFDAYFDPQGQHVRFYSARSLREHLAVTGFADVTVRPAGGVPGLRETLVARAVRA
jgi:SAM-dependent methyltransferase